MEAVKRRILARMGLHSPPVIRRSPDEDELHRMYRVYEETLAELRGNSRKGANLPATPQKQVHLLTPKLSLKTKTSCRDQNLGKYCQTVNLVFSRTRTLRQELSVVRAELQLYKRAVIGQSSIATRTSYKSPLMVNVYKVAERVGTNGEKTHTLLDSKPLDIDTLSLNVLTAVELWIAGDGEILQLEVTLVSDVPLPSEVNLLIKGAEAYVLEVETQEVIASGLKNRRELPTNREDCKKDEKKCCRKSLDISFKEIGWDWVIAPQGFTMFFCEGSCPHNHKPAGTHALMKSRAHNVYNGAVSAPCCVPVSYDPMVLMHHDSNGSLSLASFEDILVQKCRCA